MILKPGTHAATRHKARARSLPRPLRAVLHGLLLRGLRPTRLAHDAAWPQGALGTGRMRTFEVRGRRGQRLAAWLAVPMKATQPAPLVVAMHGWGANASTLSAMLGPLLQAGMAVVLFDAANHGESSAEDFSSLPRFAEDLGAVLQALRQVQAVDARRIALLGHSVGAGAVLLHAARAGGVKAIVSLSAFAHPREMMERWMQAQHIPMRWVGTAILEHVQEVIGERFDHIAPLHQLPRIECPVLLLHGAQDRTVPLSDAHRLRAALRHGELLVVDGDHDLRPALTPHAERLVGFLATHLQAHAG
ncbi:MAG: alpha/beta fold hydrolase [Burkholderiales bacterium]|nr:alpha/beta fold hydrolase [Burkholderiales bacterium]